MHYWDIINGSPMNLYRVFNDKLDDDEEKNKFELMQYVGKKDKNGREIYEDDIFTLNWSSVTEKYIVVINKGWQSDCIIEVIGNIYENPDLLEKENELL